MFKWVVGDCCESGIVIMELGILLEKPYSKERREKEYETMMNTIIDNLKKLEQRYMCSMRASVPRMRSAGLLAGVLAFVWWCVLYPELCFPQDTYEAVYEAGEGSAAKEGVEKEGAEQESSALTEENCCRLLRADKEQVIVKSRLLEWLEQHIE